MDLKQRWEEIAGRFTKESASPPPGAPPVALREDYWQSLQELFTVGVTGESLLELLQRDPQETLRFFSRQIDFTSLKSRPWYERYPLAAWKVFLAMAYRLSPARRVVFAGAVLLLLLFWLRAIFARLAGGGVFFSTPAAGEWLLFAATAVLLLLVLELRDKLTLKGDLEVARQIQFGLLPFRPYQGRGCVVESTMRPANTVGGDYFDVIEIGGGGLAVVIGDVAGKGMPAALLMALLQGSLRTLLTAGLRGPALVEKLNAHLHENIPTNRLITLFYAELDEAGRLSYVNAGHNAPFLLRASGAVERLEATGIALGVVHDAAFAQRAATLGPGDRVYLFTDGITEAFDASDQEYGEARLEQTLLRSRERSPRELVEAVEADVIAFAGSQRPRDDMTSLVLERLAVGPRAETVPQASGPVSGEG